VGGGDVEGGDEKGQGRIRIGLRQKVDDRIQKKWMVVAAVGSWKLTKTNLLDMSFV
jgi:hypothetical protein